MVQAAYPRLAAHSTRFQRVCMHTAMNIFTSLANQLRPFVLWFALLSALIGLLLLLPRRFGPARYWKFEGLIAVALITGMGGCGLGLAMPAAWTWPILWLPGGILAASIVGTGVWFMALAALAYGDGEYRLQHRPSFGPPVVQAAPAITAGIIEPGAAIKAPVECTVSSGCVEHALSMLAENIARAKNPDPIYTHEMMQIVILTPRRFTHNVTARQ
jgi:hypothetical protein